MNREVDASSLVSALCTYLTGLKKFNHILSDAIRTEFMPGLKAVDDWLGNMQFVLMSVRPVDDILKRMQEILSDSAYHEVRRDLTGCVDETYRIFRSLLDMRNRPTDVGTREFQKLGDQFQGISSNLSAFRNRLIHRSACDVAFQFPARDEEKRSILTSQIQTIIPDPIEISKDLDLAIKALENATDRVPFDPRAPKDELEDKVLMMCLSSRLLLVIYCTVAVTSPHCVTNFVLNRCLELHQQALERKPGFDDSMMQKAFDSIAGRMDLFQPLDKFYAATG